MKCAYDDGLKVDYAGSLRITQGKDVNVFLRANELPANIKGELEDAALRNSCREVRHVAQEVTDILGSNIPE
jgi:hypothetical protein